MTLELLDLVIVGGGPVGLNAAIMSQEKGLNFLLIESQESLGGQLMELYPEKEILDLHGIEVIQANHYIDSLIKKLNSKSLESIFISTKLIGFKPINDLVELQTSNGIFTTKKVLLTTGMGVYTPRLMGIPGEQGCQKIIYSLKKLDFLKGKKVIVMGGGDSAIDWTREMSKHSPEVTLIHRRNEFRGDISLILNLKNITIKTPFIPIKVLNNDGIATGIEIEHVDTKKREILLSDFIFVNYGHAPISDTFGLLKLGFGIKVDAYMQTSIPLVYAAGDAASYEGKTRRIESGISELKTFFKNF